MCFTGCAIGYGRCSASNSIQSLTLPLQYIDKRYFGSILTANEKQRVANEREESDEDRRAGLRGPKRSWTLAGFIVAICMITTA